MKITWSIAIALAYVKPELVGLAVGCDDKERDKRSRRRRLAE
jgi:hypothetical protein